MVKRCVVQCQMTVIVLKNCQSLEKVPLAQVNLIAGEEQWRLLHRMTGPRDQVRNSRLHVCLVYIEKSLQKLIVLCCFL